MACGYEEYPEQNMLCPSLAVHRKSREIAEDDREDQDHRWDHEVFANDECLQHTEHQGERENPGE